MIKFDLSKKSWQWITLAAIALIWGSSFILMKKGLRSFEYGQVAGFRVFISFIILIPTYFKNIRKINKKNILHILVSAYTGIFIPSFLFTKAQTQISSSLAGMINSMVPFFTLFIGVLLYKNRPGKWQYLGILLGLVGALGLITDGKVLNTFDSINGYALFVVLATICYGINANEIRFKLKDLNGVEITSLSFLLIGPVAGVYLLFTDFQQAIASPDWLQNMGFIFFLALFGSVISLFFFNNLIHHASALFATSVTYIVPFFAIIWGLFDGETITIVHIFSICVTLLGVWLVNKKKTAVAINRIV